MRKGADPVTNGRAHLRLSLVVAAVALGAAACGSPSVSNKPTAIFAGEVPPSAVIVGGKASLASNAKATATTVPLAKQSPETALFSALGIFESCLKGQHMTYIGLPKPSDPSSPANNPNYLNALKTCAAQSNIIQALDNAKTAQENLTPAQVKAENNTYLKWRTCMISKGWVVSMPKPNSQGALFSFGGSGGGSKMTPPAGQSGGLNSPDISECLTLAQEGKT